MDENSKEKVLYTAEKLSKETIALLPEDTRDLNQLRCKLSDIFQTKFEANYAKLEYDSSIKTDTFQKALNFKRNRKITRDFLEKFCIGAKLSIKETKELFKLSGVVFNEMDRRDMVFLKSIEAQSTIDEYNEDLIDCGFPGILRE